MNRRDFILTSGVVGASHYLPNVNWSQESKYKMGYQLFSIRDRMADDPVGTLKSLKSFGYQEFEIYGFDDKKDKIYGMSPSELHSILSDLDLTTKTGHYGFSNYMEKSDTELLHFVDRCHSCALRLRSKYITWPWVDPKYRNVDFFKIMIKKLNLIGNHLKDSGVLFAYHNHGFEFEVHDGEKTGYDLIIENTDQDQVKLQMDMYWVMHSAKITPKQLVENQKGRFVMWHIKDMDALTRDYTELGNGSINYLNVLPNPKDSGLEFCYIEQGGNFAKDSLQSAKDSANFYQQFLSQKIV